MKIAIVSGASSGLGREFVRQIERLYKDLDEIWVVARRKERLLELKERMHVYVRVFDGDLQEELVYKQILNRLENQSPDIRMLVNAAGYGKVGKIEELSESEQLGMIDVNCRALTQMTKLCLPYMHAGTRIVNLASSAAFCPQPSFSVYAATKSYVLSFSEGLSAEVEEKGICVTAVCPGPVDTEFFDVAGDSYNDWKKLVMAEPQLVVRQALLDAKVGKRISVYGIPMKVLHVVTKVVPTAILLETVKRFW